MERLFRFCSFAFLFGLSIVAPGCGGGGGGSTTSTTSATTVGSAPAMPTLALTPQSIKTFSFTWTDVSGETEYRLLESPDGASEYVQIATIAADATSHDLTVSLPARVNARYILQACNSSGCTDSAPVSVTGTLASAIGYIKASNTGASDAFGYAITISADGNTLAVGARQEDSSATGIDGNQADNGAGDSGAVYVFIRNGATWSQEAYVKASNTGAGDMFGSAVALSADGNTLAVGAYQEDSNATGIDGNQTDNSFGNSGAVYVFTRSGVVWSQQAYVKASNTGAGDMFGSVVALSGDGNTLAVGANMEESNATGIDGNQTDNSFGNSGAVYVFTRSGVVWSQQAYVKASNTQAGDAFGSAVALSGDGNTLAVGAFQEDSDSIFIDGNQGDNSAGSSGAVYVFTRNGVVWSQQAYVKTFNTGAGDMFGSAVALSGDGNTLVAGAPGEDSNATGIGGNQGDNSFGSSGAVYVFARSGVVWSQRAYVKASNTGVFEVFGSAVALSADGNTFAVGAYLENSSATGIGGDQTDNSAGGSGAVYVFARNGVLWSQQAYVKGASTDSSDNFGSAVALSGDGNTLVAGAPGEDSNATGIDGNQTDNSFGNSGAVYVY